MSTIPRDYKQMGNETSESFNSQKLPLQERSANSTSLPFVTQIQELMYTLTRKKADLREAKLQHSNLAGKCQQQDARINDMEITMEHSVEREELMRENNERISEEIAKSKDQIRQMTLQIKDLKEKVVMKGEQIIQSRKEKIKNEDRSSELEWKIKQKEKENQNIDVELQKLQLQANLKQNDLRSKQDQISQKMLQKIELTSLIAYLEEKIKAAMKNRHEATCEQKELIKQTAKCEQKITNIKKEITEVNWNSQQNHAQNTQIEELNSKLKEDLQATEKHLTTMKRANKMLQDSLDEYGLTGEHVTRLIHSARRQ